MPRFRNVGKRDAPFLRGYGLQGAAAGSNWTRGAMMPGFGASLKRSLRESGPWFIYVGGPALL